MQTKSLKKALWILVPLLFIAAFAIAARLSDHSLEKLGVTRLPCSDADYVWASNNEIITFEATPFPGTGGQQNQPAGYKVGAKRTDIRTGISIAIPELYSIVESVQVSNWRVSPDGALLLCKSKKDHDRWFEQVRWSTFPLKSDVPPTFHRMSKFPDPDWGEPQLDIAVWTADSKRIVTLSADPGYVAYIASVDMPGIDPQPFALPHNDQTTLGITSDNRIVWTSWLPQTDKSPPPPKSVEIYQHGVYPNETPQTRCTVAVPDKGVVEAMCLSPEGDRIAWTISSIHHSPLEPFMQKHFKRWAKAFAPHEIVSIYIGKTSGGKLQLLGSEDVPLVGREDALRFVRWLPDGKRLSFRYLKRICTVQAP